MKIGVGRRAVASTLLIGLVLTGCAAPDAAPAPAPPVLPRPAPAPAATPTPSSAPRLPALEELVITPAGIGSLLIGHPVTETDMVVFDPDYCTFTTEDGAEFVDPGYDPGRWVANYTDADPFGVPFAAHVADGTVQIIEVLSRTLATSEGIRVGSSLGDLTAAYPSIALGIEGPLSDTFLVSTATGAIVFEVLNDGVYAEYVPDTIARIQVTGVGYHNLQPSFASDALIGGCL